MPRPPPTSTLFPTRRSSDLAHRPIQSFLDRDVDVLGARVTALEQPRTSTSRDRKSTRLNSSHGSISYAVFCLKKKKEPTPSTTTTTNPSPSLTRHCKLREPA